MCVKFLRWFSALHASGGTLNLCSTKRKDIKTVIERRPFRPFLLRLTNGSEYEINEPCELGAPRDYHTLVYFGATDFVLIDRDSVVEIAVK